MAHAEEMQIFERVIVRADEWRWVTFPRAVLGYALVPTWTVLTGRQSTDWTLIPFFLGVLVALRLVPVVLRKLLPFSPAVRAIWTERRELAKRYDSYQWQKLLGMGLGLAIYTVQTTPRPASLIALTGFCLLGGAVGMATWRRGGGRVHKQEV
jgi:hypothetical protein